MNETPRTLHQCDATWGSRNGTALHSRSTRSTETHARQRGSGGLRTCLTSLLVCVTVALTACGSNGPQPARATSTARGVDLCADTLQPVPAGVTNGKLVSTINQGRILIGIGVAGAGTIALAYIDAGGLHVVPMAHDGTLDHADWAPDGTIGFDSERAGGRHLFRIATDGSGLTQITKEAGTAEEGVSFSRDGGRIAYAHGSCVEERDLGIQVAKADGSNPDDFGAATPRWSPDGKQILFGGQWSAGVEDHSLWVVQAAGGEPHRLFKRDAAIWELDGDWSPDGSQIVFGTFTPASDHDELWIAAADGTHERTLWVGSKSMGGGPPHWGP